ncbi:MAG: hypothetical protein ACTS8H_02855, partial [Arsenophonus sp. NC-PE1-MAG3]
VIAAIQGAQIIRAHDVKETVQAMKIIQETFLIMLRFRYSQKEFVTVDYIYVL